MTGTILRLGILQLAVHMVDGMLRGHGLAMSWRQTVEIQGRLWYSYTRVRSDSEYNLQSFDSVPLISHATRDVTFSSLTSKHKERDATRFSLNGTKQNHTLDGINNFEHDTQVALCAPPPDQILPLSFYLSLAMTVLATQRSVSPAPTPSKKVRMCSSCSVVALTYHLP